jgi:kinesin family protein 6/9
VVLAASERGRDHVPYRSCKLTHVLKDSIVGNCCAVLVANVWGDASQLEETLSTCRWEILGREISGREISGRC